MTLTNDKKELDPMIEIFAGRVMQLRRTICKQKGMAKRYKDLLEKCADNNKKNGKWPVWYQEIHRRNESQNQRPMTYPCEQPHPSTNQHDSEWRMGMQP